MVLIPKRMTGPRNRKAGAFSAEIWQLRSHGYTFEVIREAVSGYGAHVSNWTVQQEVARTTKQFGRLPDTSAVFPSVAPLLTSSPTPADRARARAQMAALAPEPPACEPPLPAAPQTALTANISGKDFAEAFTRNRINNSLIRTGDRGGDLTGAAPSGTQRSDLQAGLFAKRASFTHTHSVKQSGTAIPGHGKGPPRVSAGIAGLALLRQVWKPVRGETPRWLDAQRNSPAPHNGETPKPTETLRHHLHQLRNHAQRQAVRRHTSHVQYQPGSPFRELRVFRGPLIDSES